MKIEETVWLKQIVEKLQIKHNVLPHEVEEALANKPYFQMHQKGHQKGENLYFAISQTNSGRYLIIFFIYKEGNKALIISARDVNRENRKLYDRRKN